MRYINVQFICEDTVSGGRTAYQQDSYESLHELMLEFATFVLDKETDSNKFCKDNNLPRHPHKYSIGFTMTL